MNRCIHPDILGRKSMGGETTVEACPTCFASHIVPHMGFELGKVYRCQHCGYEGAVIIEFDSIDAWLAFRDGILSEEE